MEHTPSEEAVDHGNEIVHIDGSFELLVPKFLTNRKKEVPTMQGSMTT